MTCFLSFSKAQAVNKPQPKVRGLKRRLEVCACVHELCTILVFKEGIWAVWGAFWENSSATPPKRRSTQPISWLLDWFVCLIGRTDIACLLASPIIPSFLCYMHCQTLTIFEYGPSIFRHYQKSNWSAGGGIFYGNLKLFSV